MINKIISVIWTVLHGLYLRGVVPVVGVMVVMTVVLDCVLGLALLGCTVKNNQEILKKTDFGKITDWFGWKNQMFVYPWFAETSCYYKF